MVSLRQSGLLLLVVVLLGGCASTGQIADQVVKSNKAQELAQNQLVLLNVLRAYKRRPMHFTGISQLRLPVGFGSPTIKIPTPLGPDRTHVYGVESSFAISQSVDTTVQSSQEFIRGITTPLTPSLMLYYLDQGWPQQLVLHMFVRKIEVYQGDFLKEEFLNYPESQSEFSNYQNLVEKLKDCDFKADLVAGKPYGPKFTGAELKRDVQGLASANSSSLSLTPEGNDFRFTKESKSISLTPTQWVEKPAGYVCELPEGAASIAAAGEAGKSKESSSGTSVRFVMRSPEAMLYYLGEIARTNLNDSRPISFAYSSLRNKTHGVDRAALFIVKKGQDSSAAVSVDYDGENYFIPEGSSSDRSMHVLSLLMQVLGLQSKGDNLPSTANVRVIP